MSRLDDPARIRRQSPARPLSERRLRAIGRHAVRAVIVAVLAGTLGGAIAACGQRGPLYLPDSSNPDKRR